MKELYKSEKVSDQKLSPLHLAVIRNDTDSLERLLEEGTDPDVVDSRGWTPLHHAALCQTQACTKCLLKVGASPNLQTDTGATYQDIIQLTSPQPIVQDQKIPLYLRDENGVETQLTADDYQRIRKAEFVNESIFTREKYFNQWLSSTASPIISKSTQYYVDHYETLCQSFPALALVSVGDGHGLFARTQIEKGECVGEYHGLWTHEETVSSCYSVDDGPDAKNYGNATAFMNDGFPNACLLPLPNVRGIPIRTLVVAMDTISSGEQICFNYGGFRVREEPYTVFREKEMEAFMGGTGIVDMVDRFALNLANPEADFEAMNFVDQLSYVLQTPQALWRLILKEVIPYDASFHLVAAALYTGLADQEQKPFLEELLRLTKTALELKKEITEANPKASEEFTQTLIDLPEKFPMSEVLIHANTLCKAWRAGLTR